MLLKDKILPFTTLRHFILENSNLEQIQDWARKARNQNAWFTEDNVLLSLRNIAENYLNEEKLNSFCEKYPALTLPRTPKKVGLVLAGNIPLVGFHDLLCVLLSGNVAHVKLSSTDSVLMQIVIEKLYEFDSELKNCIQVVDRLNDVDALIATGSDNTAKHFEYYFAKKPHIIRKNRSSVAILDGSENRIELSNLADDVFQYFGLGCRNVSKFYVPEGYKFDKFYESIEHWNTILIHHKYQNNYDYNKAIYLVNQDNFFDNGFLLIKEDKGVVSPISVVFFEKYRNVEELKTKIDENINKIQCLVSKSAWYEGSINFGQAQCPTLDDFADKVDTMQFLLEI